MSNRTKTDSPFFGPITSADLRVWAGHCKFPTAGPDAGHTDDELILAVRARSLVEFSAMALQTTDAERRAVAAETMLDLGHGHRGRVDAVLPRWAGSNIAALYNEADPKKWPGASVHIVLLGGDIVVRHRRLDGVMLGRDEEAVWMRDMLVARGAKIDADAAAVSA